METREVYAVISTSDLTEGRGSHYVKAYCETSGTAQRIAYKAYVQGGNCPIEKRTLYKPDGEVSWFGPVNIEKPNEGDMNRQVELDSQSEAISKARAAGLSDHEIKLIKAAL
jgi:hypothetical protein